MNTLLTITIVLALLIPIAASLCMMAMGFIEWSPSLRRRRLKKWIRQWLPVALKKGPTSVEWRLVEEWSWELRDLE